MFELEGQNVAAATSAKDGPVLGKHADLCDVPQRIVRVNKRMLQHKGNHGQFPHRAGFFALFPRSMHATGNNMKPARSPHAKVPIKAPTGIPRPKDRRHTQPDAAPIAGFGTGNTRGMKPGKSLPPRDANEEAFAMIEVLHETEQRLQELTASEVNVVVDRRDRKFLLRRPQEQSLHIEAAEQAAILNALPAHIALLDTQGRIISVNEAWRRFGSANAIQGPGCGIGVNYLEVCDAARGDGSSEAHQAAEGIRSVLSGGVKSFSIEYHCHSPTEQRWFLLMVRPLADDRPIGAVVMHLDVTAERQAKESLRASESLFRQIAENIRDVFFLVDADSNRTLYVSPAYEEIWGRSCASAYANPDSWTEAIHPDDRTSIYEKHKNGVSAGKFAYKYRVVRPDGSIRWMQARGFPVRDDAGKTVRIAGVAEDITERKLVADELRESDRRFSDMLGNVDLISIMLDREVRVTYCNDYFLRLTGWQREQVLGQNFIELFIPPDLVEELRDVNLALHANLPKAWHHENEILTHAGERRLIRWNNSVLRSGVGDVIGTASIGEDITEQKRAEIGIKHLNRVYAVLSGINTLIVHVRDRDELFKEACRIAVEQGGFRMSLICIADRSAMKIVPVASAGKDEELLTAIKSMLSSTEGAPNTMVARAMMEKKAIVSNDSQSDPQVLLGKKYAEAGVRSVAVLPLIASNEPVGVLALYASEIEFFHEEEIKLLTDLTSNISFALDHIEKEKKLNYLAYYDVLTGLANRSLFLERLAPYMRSAVSSGHKLALFLIDLERFKNINDSLGRPAGDALLRQVAEWLTRNVGDANLLARVGADHFAVVLPDVKQEGDVTRLLEKTMEALPQHPFQLNDAEFRIAAKIGVALFPDDGANADTLFKNAEAALKKTKTSGDRYLFYTQKMTETVASKLTLENQLRQALEKGEFVLHYQPKVSLANGKLTSAEALIRWNDPRTGLVPPGRFIPVLEETGLIYEVGRWALHKAIEDYLRWRNAGLAAVPIAVNVSPLQLRHRNFIAEIKGAIGIDAHAAAGLELEITESLIMEDVKHSIASLQAIRAMGVSIAIDDFGTGFSSLSYLSKLPVDTLKIDRSFVNDMTSAPEGLALVSTIINLARSLKLKVVAEGVETEEQSRLLRLLSCDEMQGYLFSKPVPSEIFEARYLAPPSAA
jgi:diguanylate cyclase (GGDEF)-like protein/PAS domain S-box-containing protein